MKNSIIQVLIYLSAHPGKAAELKQALLEALAKRCQEIGCQTCQLLQDSINPENFILVEEWGIQERLESKLNPDYLQDFFLQETNLLAVMPSFRWFYVTDSVTPGQERCE